MIFRFNGQEFDTDKRIFVLGYVIGKTWFPYRDNEPICKSHCLEYGPTVKSFYVRSVLFDTKKIDGRTHNFVTGLEFDFGASRNSGVGREYIVGHSAKECLKIYQEKTCSTEY